jgi:hypothetical protein
VFIFVFLRKAGVFSSYDKVVNLKPCSHYSNSVGDFSSPGKCDRMNVMTCKRLRIVYF